MRPSKPSDSSLAVFRQIRSSRSRSYSDLGGSGVLTSTSISSLSASEARGDSAQSASFSLSSSNDESSSGDSLDSLEFDMLFWHCLELLIFDTFPRELKNSFSWSWSTYVKLVLEGENYFGLFRPNESSLTRAAYHFMIQSRSHQTNHRALFSIKFRIGWCPCLEYWNFEICDVIVESLHRWHTRRIRKWHKAAERINHNSRSTGPIYEFCTSFYAQLSWLSESAKTLFSTIPIVIRFSD